MKVLLDWRFRHPGILSFNKDGTRFLLVSWYTTNWQHNPQVYDEYDSLTLRVVPSQYRFRVQDYMGYRSSMRIPGMPHICLFNDGAVVIYPNMTMEIYYIFDDVEDWKRFKSYDGDTQYSPMYAWSMAQDHGTLMLREKLQEPDDVPKQVRLIDKKHLLLLSKKGITKYTVRYPKVEAFAFSLCFGRDGDLVVAGRVLKCLTR